MGNRTLFAGGTSENLYDPYAVIYRLCGWCNSWMGEEPDDPDAVAISHVLCSTCSEAVEAGTWTPENET